LTTLDQARKRPPSERKPVEKEETARKAGGNPDAPPSANAGNVGLGGEETDHPPASRKP
jgi:hypothetical protein